MRSKQASKLPQVKADYLRKVCVMDRDGCQNAWGVDFLSSGAGLERDRDVHQKKGLFGLLRERKGGEDAGI